MESRNGGPTTKDTRISLNKVERRERFKGYGKSRFKVYKILCGLGTKKTQGPLQLLDSDRRLLLFSMSWNDQVKYGKVKNNIYEVW